jgi:imidazole glycerol phosphate synthase subunit HisF
LQNGADKVSINSSALKIRSWLMIWHKIWKCVVVAIDAKQIDGQWIVHLVGGKVPYWIYLIGQRGRATWRRWNIIHLDG